MTDKKTLNSKKAKTNCMDYYVVSIDGPDKMGKSTLV